MTNKDIVREIDECDARSKQLMKEFMQETDDKKAKHKLEEIRQLSYRIVELKELQRQRFILRASAKKLGL